MNKETDTKEWLTIARKDWERMKRNLKEKDIGASSFFLQQSLEKFIKAYLLSHGWELKKVHHLDFLINEAAKYNPDLLKFKKICRRISSYYILERYPPFEVDVTEEELKADLKEAVEVIKALFPEEDLK